MNQPVNPNMYPAQPQVPAQPQYQQPTAPMPAQAPYAAPAQQYQQPPAQPPMQPQPQQPQYQQPPQQAPAPQYQQPQAAVPDFASAFGGDSAPDMHEVVEGGAAVAVGDGLGRLCAAVYVGKQHYTSRGGYKQRGEMHLAYELISPVWPEVEGRRPVKREILNYSFNSRARLRARMLEMDPNNAYRNMFQMVNQVFLITLGEEANQQGGTYIAIKSVKFPVVRDPRTGAMTNYAEGVGPATVQLMAFNYDHPVLQHWDSIFIAGTYEDGATRNAYQNAVRCAVDFQTGPVAQMLQAAGRDLWTDYDMNGQPVPGSQERNVRSVNEWVAFKQGRGPFPGSARNEQNNGMQVGAQQPQYQQPQTYAQPPMQPQPQPQQAYTPMPYQAPVLQGPAQPQAPAQPQYQQPPMQPQPQPQPQPQQPPAQPLPPGHASNPSDVGMPPMTPQQPAQGDANQLPSIPPQAPFNPQQQMPQQPQYAPGSTEAMLDDNIPH